MRAFLLICVSGSLAAIGCGGAGSPSDTAVTEPDTASSTTSETADPDSLDRGSDSGVDSHSGLDSESADSESLPEPAAPCAEDLDADKHPESFVSEYYGRVTPKYGAMIGGDYSFAPDQAGPFAVQRDNVSVPMTAQEAEVLGHMTSIQAGELSGTLFWPSQASATGPHPVVLVLPGFSATHGDYDHFSEHLASHGFAVLGLSTRSNPLSASHDKEALEVLQALSWLLSEQSPLLGQVNAEKVAVCGASKGGKIAFLAASLDPRIDLVVGWDPSNSGGPPCSLAPTCNALPVGPNCMTQETGVLHLLHAESLVFGAPRDPGMNPDRHHNAIHFYRGAPSPASFVQYDGGHAAPSKTGAVSALISKVQTAVLLARFHGYTGLEALLPWTEEGRVALEQEPLVLRTETK